MKKVVCIIIALLLICIILPAKQGTGAEPEYKNDGSRELESGDTLMKKSTSYPGGYWEPGRAKYKVSKLKSRLRVPISGGKYLNAAAYYPVSSSDETFPVVIEWTCYSGSPDSYYAQYGYISVMVWMRSISLTGLKNCRSQTETSPLSELQLRLRWLCLPRGQTQE